MALVPRTDSRQEAPVRSSTRCALVKKPWSPTVCSSMLSTSASTTMQSPPRIWPYMKSITGRAKDSIWAFCSSDCDRLSPPAGSASSRPPKGGKPACRLRCQERARRSFNALGRQAPWSSRCRRASCRLSVAIPMAVCLLIGLPRGGMAGVGCPCAPAFKRAVGGLCQSIGAARRMKCPCSDVTFQIVRACHARCSIK